MTAERKIREFAMIDEDELSSLNDQGQGVEVPSAPDWRSVLRISALRRSRSIRRIFGSRLG